MNIKSRQRLMATSTEVRALTDKKALARKLSYELERFLLGSQFNRLDNSIGFRCEKQHVLISLKNLGFKEYSDGMLRRSDMVIKLIIPHEDWNPVLYII